MHCRVQQIAAVQLSPWRQSVLVLPERRIGPADAQKGAGRIGADQAHAIECGAGVVGVVGLEPRITEGQIRFIAQRLHFAAHGVHGSHHCQLLRGLAHPVLANPAPRPG